MQVITMVCFRRRRWFKLASIWPVRWWWPRILFLAVADVLQQTSTLADRKSWMVRMPTQMLRWLRHDGGRPGKEVASKFIRRSGLGRRIVRNVFVTAEYPVGNRCILLVLCGCQFIERSMNFERRRNDSSLTPNFETNGKCHLCSLPVS